MKRRRQQQKKDIKIVLKIPSAPKCIMSTALYFFIDQITEDVNKILLMLSKCN